MVPKLGQVSDYCEHFDDYDDIVVNEGGPEIWAEKLGALEEERSHKHGLYNKQTPAAAISSRSREVQDGIKEPLRPSWSQSSSDIPETASRGPSIPSKTALTSQLSDHQLLLLFWYPRVFALKTKLWCKSRLYTTSTGYTNLFK